MRQILLTALVVLSCGAPGATPTGSESPSGFSTSTAASGTPSPRPSVSSADVTDAGVLFFFSFSKARWLRFDSATGRLTDVGYASVAVQAQTSHFIYLGGPQGSTSLLRWDGTLDSPYDCGGGGFVSFNAAGACATFGSHTGAGPLPITAFPTPPVAVRLPGEARPRVILPADWGAVAAALSPDSARLSVARVEPPYPTESDQPFRTSLWIVEVADGAARLLYRPAPGKGLPLEWSSNGKYLTGVEVRQGDLATRLLLIDVESGRVADLGTTPALPESIKWSSDGRLAFVRGLGGVTWSDKEVVVRDRDGSERVVTPSGFCRVRAGVGPGARAARMDRGTLGRWLRLPGRHRRRRPPRCRLRPSPGHDGDPLPWASSRGRSLVTRRRSAPAAVPPPGGDQRSIRALAVPVQPACRTRSGSRRDRPRLGRSLRPADGRRPEPLHVGSMVTRHPVMPRRSVRERRFVAAGRLCQRQPAIHQGLTQLR